VRKQYGYWLDDVAFADVKVMSAADVVRKYGAIRWSPKAAYYTRGAQQELDVRRVSKRNPRSRRNGKGYDTDFSRELSMFDYHAPQFEQTVGQFSVTEAFTHGLQPANRRNPRKKSRR